VGGLECTAVAFRFDFPLMKRAKRVPRIDSFLSGIGIMKKNGHQGHSFAFNILAAILQARNSLQSPNVPRVTPGMFDGAALAACPGENME
jgi:hypothetical protein